MKYPLIVSSVLLLASAQVVAEEMPAAPSDSLSATVNYASDYIFRGLTQTWGNGALQASVDYTHASGFYASVWASNVDPKVYAGGHGEVDLSAGYKWAISDDWGLNVSVLRAIYPGANYNKIRYASYPDQKWDNTEASVALSYQWLSLKYGYTLTDLLGFNEKTGFTKGTRGSTYLDLSADIPLPDDFSLGLHVGHQNVAADLVTPTAEGATNPDFYDYRVALNRRFADGWLGVLAWTRNTNGAYFNKTPSNYGLSETYDLGKPRVTLSVFKTF